RVTETFSVGGPSPSITISSATDLGAIAAGSPYTNTLTACCATSYAWSVIGGALPPGLGLSAAGVLRGRPTTVVSYTFLIKAADSSNSASYGQRQFTVTVVASGTLLSITTGSTLPYGNVSSAYMQTLAATGGSGSVTWALAPFNVLPPGLSLS